MISDPAQYMAIALFVSFIVLIFTGYPVAWLMGGLAVLFTAISVFSDNYLDTFFGVDWGYSSIVVARVYAVMNNWVLVALPMFVFMGIMMDKSGIAEDLMTDLAKLFGRVRGGLAITIVVIGVLLAASTGIIGAAVVLLAILGVPLMLKHQYDTALACGVVCATGTLGILIPPSIMLVLMADQVRVSVGDLFMGAMFPGLMLGGLYAVFILTYAWMRPLVAPAPIDAEPVSIKTDPECLQVDDSPGGADRRRSGKHFLRHRNPNRGLWRRGLGRDACWQWLGDGCHSLRSGTCCKAR